MLPSLWYMCRSVYKCMCVTNPMWSWTAGDILSVQHSCSIVARSMWRRTDWWGGAQIKEAGEPLSHCLLHLSWVPQQSNSPGVWWMTPGVFYRWGLSQDSHRLTHLSVTQMFLLVFSSQQGHSSTLLGHHLQMFNQRETLPPHWE